MDAEEEMMRCVLKHDQTGVAWVCFAKGQVGGGLELHVLLSADNQRGVTGAGEALRLGREVQSAIPKLVPALVRSTEKAPCVRELRAVEVIVLGEGAGLRHQAWCDIGCEGEGRDARHECL